MQGQFKKLKGQGTGGLSNFALGFGALVIIVSIVATILAQIQTTQTANTVAFNVTQQGLTAVSQFSLWFIVIVIVAIGAFVIGILSFMFGRRGAGGGY